MIVSKIFWVVNHHRAYRPCVHTEICADKHDRYMQACEDTGHSEDPEMTVSPDLVLTQQKGEEHEQTPVMHHPPDVNVSLHPVLVTREPVDPLGHQYSQLPPG